MSCQGISGIRSALIFLGKTGLESPRPTQIRYLSKTVANAPTRNSMLSTFQVSKKDNFTNVPAIQEPIYLIFIHTHHPAFFRLHCLVKLNMKMVDIRFCRIYLSICTLPVAILPITTTLIFVSIQSC